MKYIPILIFVCIFGALFARNDVKFHRPKAITAKLQPYHSIEDKIDTIDVTRLVKDDSVYCLKTYSRNSWQEPILVVSEAEASKMPFCIRLSNKNKHGNYCRLEVFKRNLRKGTHSFDFTINELLPDSLKTNFNNSLVDIHKIEFIPDLTGEYVLQEKYYDVNGNLLGFAMFDYDQSHRVVTERYHNHLGLPSSMAELPGWTSPYGIQLRTHRDKAGNDSILELIYQDSTIANKDGVFYLQREFFTDKENNKWMVQRSLDENGDRIVDKSGNCGFKSLFNKNNDHIYSFYIDTYDDKINIENSYDPMMKGVCIQKYEYDKYGLITKTSFYDKNNNPINNGLGTHAIYRIYEEENLNCDSIYARDIDGNLSPLGDHGFAMQTFKYDSLGNQTEYHQYGCDGKPYASEGYISSRIITFDGAKIVKQSDFVWNPSVKEEINTYLYIDNLSNAISFYEDNSTRIINRDYKGRMISDLNYNEIGKLSEEFVQEIFEYIENGDSIITIKTELFSDSIPKAIYITDSIAHTRWVRNFDIVGNLKSTNIQSFDDDWNIIAQTDCNEFGIPCRAGGDSGVKFLHCKASNTVDEKTYALTAIDEFGEPDYISSSAGRIFHKRQSDGHFGDDLYFDEHENLINNDSVDASAAHKTIRNMLPKLMSIEVVDSLAYALGLRDNDLILQYGDYSTDIQNPLTESQFKAQWTVRAVVDANKEKDLVVFRVNDGSHNDYGIEVIRGLSGTASQIGFVPHVRFLTQKQKNRIVSCMNEYDQNLIVLNDDAQPDSIQYAIFCFPDYYRGINTNTPYANLIKDACIFLGAVDKDHNLKWDDRDNSEISSLEKIVGRTRPEGQRLSALHYIMTTDGENIHDVRFEDRIFSLNLFDGDISQNDYDALRSLNDITVSKVDSIMNIPSRFNPKDLYGYWVINPSDSLEYDAKGYIYLDKKGSCIGSLEGYSIVPNSDIPEDSSYGSPIFKTDRNLDGEWYYSGDILNFANSNVAKTDLFTVLMDSGFEDIDIEDKINYFKKDYRKYEKYYNYKFKGMWDFPNEAYVESVDKNTLTLSNAYGYQINLIKHKGKPEIQKNPKSNQQNIKEEILGSWMVKRDGYYLIFRFYEDGAQLFWLGNNNKLKTEGLFASSYKRTFSGDYAIDGNDLKLSFSNDPKRSYMDKVQLVDIEEEKINEIEDYLSDFNISLMELTEDLSNDLANACMHIDFVTDDELSLDGTEFSKLKNPTKDIVIVSIEDETGYLATNGYSGKFVLLSYCDWNCTKDIEDFKVVLDNNVEAQKELILLPYENDDDGNIIFCQPFRINCPEGKMGIRCSSSEISAVYYMTDIFNRYLMFVE